MKSGVIKKVLLIVLAYVLVCCLIPPMFHKSVAGAKEEITLQEQESSATEDASLATSPQERILCIDDNTKALEWRLSVIEEAEEELILSTFDFRDDNSGHDMIAALYHAAERGVRIRILVDGFNVPIRMGNSRYFNALASHPNVEVKSYNPIRITKLWKVNYRLHDKYLIADDTVYILGGRNTNDLFLGNYAEHYNIDRDILVYDTAMSSDNTLHEVKDYFEEIWALDINKTWRTKDHSRYEQEGEELEEHYQSLKTSYPNAFAEVDWEEETMTVDHISLITNPIKAESKSPTLFALLCDYMAEGEDVLIQTPYIVCGNDMYDSLTQLTQSGVQLSLVTNAVQVPNDNPWGLLDYENQKSNILKTGMEVYECMNEQLIHTKAVLIDDDICILGSYNLDMRSTYLDTEMMLVIESEELNAYLRDLIAESQDKSIHVLPDGTETLGPDYESVTLPIWKRIYYTAIRIIIIPFRSLV